MSTRVSPLERIRADIDELFASERDLGDVLEEVACLGVRLLFQTVLDCLMSDFASLTTTYLRFPVGHHARIRHSNFIERTFGETRRRVKVIATVQAGKSAWA